MTSFHPCPGETPWEFDGGDGLVALADDARMIVLPDAPVRIPAPSHGPVVIDAELALLTEGLSLYGA
ncbi:MAG TPA: hypothetical protein VHE83_18250 [Mycobacteriales bacterium]|nr:hypothetical protein [Mycobacteriales bacterium]